MGTGIDGQVSSSIARCRTSQDREILVTNTISLANMCLERDFIVEGEQVLAGLATLYPQLPEDEALKARFEGVMLELSRKTGTVAGHPS